MNTKAQIMNDINYLISLIQQNKQSLSQQSFFRCRCNREILTIKDRFYTIVDNLTSEFTEQELYRIETDLSFHYKTLKELIDLLNDKLKIYHIPIAMDSIYPIQQPNNFLPVPPITNFEINSSIIQQEDLDQYTIYIQRRIDGIKKEIEKNQKMQLRKIAETHNIYNELAGNLDQKMMDFDQQLYDRQTQQHDATIKNLIAVLDGV